MTQNVAPKIYVPGVGPKDAKIVFVAEAPGMDEEKVRVPLIGYSGQFFREKLQMVGVLFDECYVTNVCHYRPPYNEISKWMKSFGKKNVCNEYILAGIIELYCDLAEIVSNNGAHVIVPMGNVALWSLTGHMNITKRRSSILSVTPTVNIFQQIKEAYPNMLPVAADAFSKIQGRKVIPTMHPAGVTRQISMSPIFLMDLQRIVEESRHPNIFLPQRTHHINPSWEEALEIARRLLEFPDISVDIELIGYHTYSVQFCGDPSWSLVLTTENHANRSLIKAICESPNRKILQFGWFDAWWLPYKDGINVNNYTYDTAIAARCAYPDFPVGLDFQTAMQTREPYYKDEGKVWRNTGDITTFLTYGGKDACVTKEIFGVHQRDELSDPGVRIAVEHKMSLVPLALEMERDGVKIDKRKQAELHAQYTKQARDIQEILDVTILKQLKEIAERNPKLKDECTKLALKMGANPKKGQPMFNVNSTGEGNIMDSYIYGIRGFKPVYKGKGAAKKRTTDEEALKELYGDTGDSLLLTIVLKRKTDKLLSTELAVKTDSSDRTYFSINVAATKTLRWTFTENIEGYGCNAQAWHPKAKEMVVADDGFIFGNFDLAQVEDRFVAYYAGVSKKIHAFENNIDAHALTAQGIFGGTIPEILAEDADAKKRGAQGPRRYLGKQSNHAYNYGEGPIRFWKRVNKKRDETGISITRAQSFKAKEAHGKLYPEVEWYQKDILARLHRDRYLINLFGWKRTHYGPINDEVERDFFSWIPQSSAPWLIDLGMLAIRRAMPDIRFCLHGHDSITCQLPINEAKDRAAEIIKLMTIPVTVGERDIIIPVDFKLSNTWSK